MKHVTGKDFPEVLRMVGEVVLGEGGRHRRSEGGGRRSNEGVVRAPVREREEWIPPYDVKRLRDFVKAVPAEAGEAAWLMERSPVDVGAIASPGEFLERVYAPGERVMVCTRYKGQGDFLWEVGRGGFRLSDDPGVRAVRSALPTDGGRDGVWFLSNPVDGRWYPNPRQGGKLSRRSQESVTGYPFLVLENDESKKLHYAAGEAAKAGKVEEATRYREEAYEAERLWKRFLACVPLPIVAIYSSGGSSWHALARVDQPDKPSFDAYLRGGEGVGPGAKRLLPAFGADPNAMTAVRLTRLPGCTRNGKLQRLIYLNPGAAARGTVKVWEMAPLRKITNH